MEENQLKKGLRNIRYSAVAQMIVLVIGIVKTLIIPNILTVPDYAYWQLYLFYISYVNLFFLGYSDGFLLKYGKLDYPSLPFEKIRSSVRFYFLMIFFFACVVFGISFTFEDTNKTFVMMMFSLSIITYALNNLCIFIFLSTNQIKRHSAFLAIDSVSNLAGALLLLILHKDTFPLLILFVFITKLIAVVVMMFLCKEAIFGKAAPIGIGFREYTDNIKIGIFIMLSNIMSMLVTGLGRIFIEYTGSIDEYAYYSFCMTILNVIMVAITAIATVMYPTLSRVSHESLSQFFSKSYNLLTYFTLMVLLLYFPANLFVQLFFQKYICMLNYLPFLFAMITWQAKVYITTNSYFRVLRKERTLFKLNIYALLFFCAVCGTLLLTLNKVVGNPSLIVAVSTLLSMIFLELLSELTIRKVFSLKLGKRFYVDMGINIVFLFCAAIGNLCIGCAAYVTFMVLYAFVQKRDIKSDILFIKDNFKKA